MSSLSDRPQLAPLSKLRVEDHRVWCENKSHVEKFALKGNSNKIPVFHSFIKHTFPSAVSAVAVVVRVREIINSTPVWNRSRYGGNWGAMWTLRHVSFSWSQRLEGQKKVCRLRRLQFSWKEGNRLSRIAFVSFAYESISWIYILFTFARYQILWGIICQKNKRLNSVAVSVGVRFSHIRPRPKELRRTTRRFNFYRRMELLNDVLS